MAAAFKMVRNPNGGKTLVSTSTPSLLLYISKVDDHAEGIDLFTDRFYLTVRGCYDAEVHPAECGRIVYAMFKAMSDFEAAKKA